MRTRRMKEALAGALALLLVAAPAALGQGATIVGLVTDRGGDPLSGAQVVLQGTRQAVVSDGRGQFTLRGLPAGTYTFDVRRIGYRSESRSVNVPAAGSVDVRFELSTSAVSLDEVVITGTGGATERRKVGASIASVDMAAIEEIAPVSSFGAALQARVPGVRSIGTVGGAGASQDLRIRGMTSFSLGQRPVVYVDGVRIDAQASALAGNNSMGTACCAIDGGAGSDRLHDLNPEDIDRVEIIKGPAAATLYGSEATNGVIQIFTKKGRTSSAPRWGLSYGAGFSRLRENLPTKLFPRFTGPDGTQALDANKTLIENGLYQDVGITVQGGGDALTYFAGAGLLYDQGSVKPNDMTRGNLRVNLTWTATDKWAFEVNSGYTRNATTLLQSGNNWTALLGNAILGNPRAASAERPYGEPWVAVADIQKLEANNSVDRWTGGVTINFTPARRFTHRLTLGLDQVSEQISKYFPYGSFYVYVGTDAEKDLGYRGFKSLTFDYLAHLSFSLPGSIGSEFSYGLQGFWEEEQRNMAVGENYAGPGVSTVDGGSLTHGAERYSKTVSAGIFAQNRFSIADKLFVTGGFRLDGNSAFGDNYGFQLYPKVDAAYDLSQEAFLPGFISSLKLRSAVGKSGLTPGAFDQFRTFEPIAVLDDDTGVRPDSPGNADLEPEKTLGLEGGFEAGLFNDRLGIDFTVYYQDTRDALLEIDLPPSQGFDEARLENVGRVVNRGWELALNAAIIEAGSFRWSSTVAMDGNRNEIKDLGERAACGISPVDGLEYCKLGGDRTRYPIGATFTRIITGYDPAANTHTRSDTTEHVGKPFPNWNGSFGNTLEFGPLRVYGLVSWEKGAVFSNGDRPYNIRFLTGDEYLSLLDANGNRTPSADSLNNYFTLVSAFDKRDNIRIREVSLSYELPSGLTNALGVGRTTLTLMGQNLYWWDDCHCVDPNIAYRGGADFGFNSGFLAAPQPRKFIASLRTSF